MKGTIHVYTGNGKGKTTAAFGLALRAAGAGLKVFIAQFVKGCEYSEIKAVQKYLPQVTVKQYGRECFIVNAPAPEDRQAARAGLEELEKIIPSGPAYRPAGRGHGDCRHGTLRSAGADPCRRSGNGDEGSETLLPQGRGSQERD